MTMKLLLKNGINKIIILLIIFLVTGFNAQAQRTSISNGNWTNPAIWSPAGVPSSFETVTINSNVILDTSISLLSVNDLIVSPGKSLKEDGIPRTINRLSSGSLVDSGTIVISYLNLLSSSASYNYDSLEIKKNLHITSTLENHGTMHVVDSLNVTSGTFTNAIVVTTDNFIYNLGTIVNDGVMNASHVISKLSFSNNDSLYVKNSWEESGSFTNSKYVHIVDTLHLYPSGFLTNYIVVTTDNFLWNEGTINNSGTLACPKIKNELYAMLNNYPNGMVVADLFDNYGVINTYNFSVIDTKDFNSSGKIYGSFGCIHVSGTSDVSGSIYGPIDFCDATPPNTFPPIDIFTGTISLGVTFCTPACKAAGVNEMEDPAISAVIYPNPVTDIITLSMTVKEKGNYTVEIYDALGQKVYTTSVEINSPKYEFKIPCNQLPKGTYLLGIKNKDAFYKTIFIKMDE